MTVQIETTAPAVLEGGRKDNSKRRTTPTPATPQLESRIKAYEDSIRTADAKTRGGYHKPGSMQKRSK